MVFFKGKSDIKVDDLGVPLYFRKPPQQIIPSHEILQLVENSVPFLSGWWFGSCDASNHVPARAAVPTNREAVRSHLPCWSFHPHLGHITKGNVYMWLQISNAGTLAMNVTASGLATMGLTLLRLVCLEVKEKGFH